jgi:hypothetical protein
MTILGLWRRKRRARHVVPLQIQNGDAGKMPALQNLKKDRQASSSTKASP